MNQYFNCMVLTLLLCFSDDFDGIIRLEWTGSCRSIDGTNLVWVLLCIGWCSVHEPLHCVVVRHICSRLCAGQGDGCHATSEDGHHTGRETEQVLSIQICSLLPSRMLTTGVSRILRIHFVLKMLI